MINHCCHLIPSHPHFSFILTLKILLTSCTLNTCDAGTIQNWEILPTTPRDKGWVERQRMISGDKPTARNSRTPRTLRIEEWNWYESNWNHHDAHQSFGFSSITRILIIIPPASWSPYHVELVLISVHQQPPQQELMKHELNRDYHSRHDNEIDVMLQERPWIQYHQRYLEWEMRMKD